MDAREHARRIDELRRKIGPKLPDLEEQDLILILDRILRPLGSGRRFLVKRRGGRYVL